MFTATGSRIHVAGPLSVTFSSSEPLCFGCGVSQRFEHVGTRSGVCPFDAEHRVHSRATGRSGLLHARNLDFQPIERLAPSLRCTLNHRRRRWVEYGVALIDFKPRSTPLLNKVHDRVSSKQRLAPISNSVHIDDQSSIRHNFRVSTACPVIPALWRAHANLKRTADAKLDTCVRHRVPPRTEPMPEVLRRAPRLKY